MPGFLRSFGELNPERLTSVKRVFSMSSLCGIAIDPPKIITTINYKVLLLRYLNAFFRFGIILLIWYIIC